MVLWTWVSRDGHSVLLNSLSCIKNEDLTPSKHNGVKLMLLSFQEDLEAADQSSEEVYWWQSALHGFVYEIHSADKYVQWYCILPMFNFNTIGIKNIFKNISYCMLQKKLSSLVSNFYKYYIHEGWPRNNRAVPLTTWVLLVSIVSFTTKEHFEK